MGKWSSKKRKYTKVAFRIVVKETIAMKELWSDHEEKCGENLVTEKYPGIAAI